MAGSSKLKGYKGDIVQYPMVPHYHVLLHTIFGKSLMTYDEYICKVQCALRGYFHGEVDCVYYSYHRLVW